MIFEDNFGILFVEPAYCEMSDPEAHRVFDDLAKKFLFIIRNFAVEIGNYSGPIVKRNKIVGANWDNQHITMGTHVCTGCEKVQSSSFDVKIQVPGYEPFYTNTLCMHYLVYHRYSIPQQTLDFINNLDLSSTSESPLLPSSYLESPEYQKISLSSESDYGDMYDTPFEQKFLNEEHKRLFPYR
jgi:hypothetical protein